MRISDEQVKHDVLTELQWEPEVSETDIGITVHDGAVTLTGTVPSYVEKLAAKRALKRVAGVRAYADEIEVRLPSDAAITDEEIARRIAHVLEWNIQIPSDEVKAEVRAGVVTLSGQVDRHYQRTYADRQVEGVRGVISVINHIHVREQPTERDVQKEIRDALHRHADVEASNVEVMVEDGTVTLAGEVESFQEMDLIEDAAWSAPGVNRVVNNTYLA